MSTSCCGSVARLAPGSFARFPTRAIIDSRLTMSDMRLLGLLCSRMGNQNLLCSISIPTIVKLLDSSETSVKRSIRSLEANNYIQVIRKKARGQLNTVNCYRVIFNIADPAHVCTASEVACDAVSEEAMDDPSPIEEGSNGGPSPHEEGANPGQEMGSVDGPHNYTNLSNYTNPPLSQDTTYPSKETPHGGTASNLLFHPAVEEEDRLATEFAAWYKHYPKKVGKAHAEKAYRTARRRKRVSQEALIQGVKNYIERKRRETRKGDPMYANPATWLNGECWLDEVWTPAALTPGQKLDLMAAGDKSVTEEMKQEWWRDPEVRAEYSRRNSRNAV